MEKLISTLAADVMVSPVVCAFPDEKLSDLEARFIDRHISGMPVVDEGKLIGFISKTDLVRMDAVQSSLDGYVQDMMSGIGAQSDEGTVVDADSHTFDLARQLTVREAMRKTVLTCSAETPVPELARMMVRHQVHRIVVTDGDKPLGIVSALDLAALLANLSSPD